MIAALYGVRITLKQAPKTDIWYTQFMAYTLEGGTCM